MDVVCRVLVRLERAPTGARGGGSMESGQDAPPTGGRRVSYIISATRSGSGDPSYRVAGSRFHGIGARCPDSMEGRRVSYIISATRSGSGDPSYRSRGGGSMESGQDAPPTGGRRVSYIISATRSGSGDPSYRVAGSRFHGIGARCPSHGR